MRVEDIMARNVVTCTPDANLESIAQLMFDNDCGIVPIIDKNKKPVSIITDRDISIAAATQHRLLSDMSVFDAKKDGEIISCEARDTVSDALESMKKAHVRRLPVVDMNGGLIGLLSIGDVIASVPRGGGGQESDEVPFDDIVVALKSIYVHH
jgi:CBS domain-containing protein